MTIRIYRSWRAWRREVAAESAPSLLINTLAQVGVGLAGIACGGDMPAASQASRQR